MPKYNFLYKKEVIAKNLDEAIKQASKIKSKFESIREEEVPEGHKESCIGFEVGQEDDGCCYGAYLKQKNEKRKT